MTPTYVFQFNRHRVGRKDVYARAVGHARHLDANGRPIIAGDRVRWIGPPTDSGGYPVYFGVVKEVTKQAIVVLPDWNFGHTEERDGKDLLVVLWGES